MNRFPAVVAHRGREGRPADLSRTAGRLVLCLASLALLGAPAHASAHTGGGFGLRGGPAKPLGWTYLPVLLAADLDLARHVSIDMRLELGEGYTAARPGLAFVACSAFERQCLRVGGSLGIASATFAGDARRAAALYALRVEYRNRLGHSRFSLALDGELLAARSADTWSRGIGVGIAMVRAF